MLDERSAKAIGQITESMRLAFGADLVSLVLYGSGAGDDFVPGRSDFNIAIVLNRVTIAHLRALRNNLRAWQKLGLAQPLLLDREFLADANDVFPMELLDIKAQHRVLLGEELFATLAVDARNLRYQSEHEARSKLMRLRALYASLGDDAERLRALLLDSVKTFVVIMRGYLRLASAQAPTQYPTVVEAFARRFGVEFPTMQRLVRLRGGDETWPANVDEVFAPYLDEVERLVELIDRVEPDASPGVTAE